MTLAANTLEYARLMDAQDPLRHFREDFLIPRHEGGAPTIYFCGNSLGLQSRSARAAVMRELDQWATQGVEGHFRGEMPWTRYHKFSTEAAARLVGALPHEVVIMNTLTVNLHLMMASFYRPTAKRWKVIMEAGAFPSDQYAVESQVRWHGYDPEEAIIEIAPRTGEDTLRMEDIVHLIELYGQETALVLFGGVHYYTGQFFDLPKIVDAGHRVGALVGLDLAHAAGNLPLQLHDWGADFAVWCTYKYLNSGPGGPSGAFVHERHGFNPEVPRLAGWWGHDEGERFQMRKGFKPMRGAEGWQLSNAPILIMASQRASLELFDQATMPALRAKSLRLTAYLEQTLDRVNAHKNLFRQITPRDPQARGCQISLLTLRGGRSLFDHLHANGVICDWREPNVIRLAPTPMYNTFQEVWQLGQILESYEEPQS